jgi:hypothetical protein
LIESPKLRYELGMAGRERAHSEFGFARLHRELDKTILGMVTGKQ